MNDDIKKSIEVLKNGGLILYPTDTIWGIGCDATNPEAVAKIFKLKKREPSKGMFILLHNANQLYSYLSDVPEIAWDLIELTTSPLTIIYPKAKNLAPNLISPKGSIGIRIVEHFFCQELLKAFHKPIVSTSANISGKPYPKHFEDVDTAILEGVDFIVPENYDNSKNPSPSSVIELGLSGQIKVIRK